MRLLDGVIFNMLIGGKNFSLLYDDPSSVLAPFYELISTMVRPTLMPKMTMKIGSRYKFTELEARHREQFDKEADWSKPALAA